MKPKERTFSYKWKLIIKNYDLYLMILPAVVIVAVFNYAPMYGVQLAFKDFFANRGIWGSPWVGVKHFTRFFQSYYWFDIIKNTLVISIYSMIVGTPFPIIFALMLNEVRLLKYKKIIQTVSYAPNFISTVVIVGMIFLFFSPESGIVNSVIKMFGGKTVDFINRPELFPSLYVWSGIWQGTGYSAIIYIAALSGIDQEQYDAAIIDGATRMQRIWHINIPGIMPTIIILFILSMGGILSVGFEKVYLMQTPLNISASQVLATYTYSMGIRNQEFGLSTAIGLMNTMVNLFMLVLVNTIARRVGETSLW